MVGFRFAAGELDRRIRIERRDQGQDEAYGTADGPWVLVVEVAAGIRDMLPSRGERLADGIDVATRPARIRIRYRAGITSDMRILIGHNLKDDDGNLVWSTERLAQIISVPAELGRRVGLEFMVEDYSTAGEAP